MARVFEFLLKPLQFSRIGALLPLLLLVIYLPAAIFACFAFSDTYSYQFIWLFFLAGLTHTIVYRLLSASLKRSQAGTRRADRLATNIPAASLALFAWAVYGPCVLYTVITAPTIPIVTAILGSDAAAIAASRELFLKAREGREQALSYVISLWTAAVMPYITAVLFMTRSKWRYSHTVIFTMTLLLSMEKALALRGILPIVVLAVNGLIKEKRVLAISLIVVFLIILVFMTGLAMGGDTADSFASGNSEYYYFESRNAGALVMNRIFWIPYVTAYDWLRYFDLVRDGKYMMGASSGTLSLLLGYSRIYAEREVFEFQFGQNETETGSANTVYFVEAFVNFGVPGVLFYSAVVAFSTYWMIRSRNHAALSCYAYYLYMIAIASLPAIVFGGGLLVILLFATFFKHGEFDQMTHPVDLKADTLNDSPPPAPVLK